MHHAQSQFQKQMKSRNTSVEVLSGIFSDLWHLLQNITETATKTGMIMVLGEITSNARIDYQGVIRACIRRIGYDSSEIGE